MHAAEKTKDSTEVAVDRYRCIYSMMRRIKAPSVSETRPRAGRPKYRGELHTRLPRFANLWQGCARRSRCLSSLLARGVDPCLCGSGCGRCKDVVFEFDGGSLVLG